MKMRNGLTLIELLVVITIIAILMGASIGGYSRFIKSADRARTQELVANTSTALNALFQKEGVWPKILRTRGATDGELDADTAYPLAAGGYMNLTVINGKLGGLDRFGILTPKGVQHVKRNGSRASLADKVGKGTLRDELLHFAIDSDGDGIIRGASVNGASVDVRANAIVWCGDVKSWTIGQTKDVK